MVHFHVNTPIIEVRADGAIALVWPAAQQDWLDAVALKAAGLVRDHGDVIKARLALERQRDGALSVIGTRASSELWAAAESELCRRALSP